ncbi:MobF family relaxase [Streptomyces sp. NPDC048350]|uniref:MobF family relaxase n=1 Tax=Streptomyces sp. NPDC048350 TaxID=3365538 RepID=UPI003718F964
MCGRYTSTRSPEDLTRPFQVTDCRPEETLAPSWNMAPTDEVYTGPQPTIYLLWALGDEETRWVIEAAHERTIERVLEWIEDEVAVIRYGKDGIYRVQPPGGLVAARFRHYEARSGMPLLHDHLLLSVKGLRLDGKWGSIHTLVLHENTVAASALYNELVAAEVCEAMGLATEPRTVTPGHRPVMEFAGVSHELIRWTSRRSDQIAACLEHLEHSTSPPSTTTAS